MECSCASIEKERSTVVAKKKKKTDDKQLDFEQALEQLTTIVDELEDGTLGLDASLGRYEEGVRLMRQCHRLLAGAERKIELLASVDDQGTPQTRPLDDEEQSLEEKADSRSQRRSSLLWDEED